MKRKAWFKDLKGLRFGRLEVLERGENQGAHAGWVCRCDCGKTKVVSANSLREGPGGAKSCGCLRAEAASQRNRNKTAWNAGKSYAINDGQRVYKQKHAWARAVLRQKGSACEECGWAKARCDVHHREPRAAGGLNTIANGWVLCPNCHRLQHELERQIG